MLLWWSYSLVVENLQKNGQRQNISIKSIDFIKNSVEIKLSQFELVIVETSE